MRARGTVTLPNKEREFPELFSGLLSGAQTREGEFSPCYVLYSRLLLDHVFFPDTILDHLISLLPEQTTW